MALTIKYDLILNTALKGVHRAAIFMGLGINAALDPNHKNYELTNITGLQLFPETKDEALIMEYKENFGVWITANGLREIIETFSVFLDQVYETSLFLAINSGLHSSQNAKKTYNNFTKKGLKDKLITLELEFGILASHQDFIVSIHKARNCLTHRQGRVEIQDCDDSSYLIVKWLGLNLFTTTKSGEIIVIDLPVKEPIFFKEESLLHVQLLPVEQRFSLGSVVHFTPKHLAEICLFITEEAKFIIRSSLDYVRGLGIEVHKSKNKSNSSQ